MGVTASIASAAVTGYSVYQQSKQRASAPTLASLNPPSVASDQMKADAAALNAGAQQRKKTAAAKGLGSTILTGAQGLTNLSTPPGKTLLGQ